MSRAVTSSVSLRGWLNAVFNVRCPLCGARLQHEVNFCELCGSGEQTVVLDGVLCLGPYGGRLAETVKELKFRGRRAFGRPLGVALAGGMRRLNWTADVIVPVPLHWTRRLSRGFNQSLLIAEGIGNGAQIPVKPWLIRVRRTAHQVKLGREQRLANLKGAFRGLPDVAGLQVLLVDDVVTTSATVKECSLALLAAGAKRVTVAAVAVTSRDRRAVRRPGVREAEVTRR